MELGAIIGAQSRLHFDALGAKLPLIVGHEMVGEVIKLGPDASGVQLGKRYIVYPWLGCGTCARCQEGAEQLCNNGSRWHSVVLDGGFSTHVVSPNAKYLVPFEKISEEFASTLACSGLTALGAIKKSLIDLPDGFNDKDKLLINGAGNFSLLITSSKQPQLTIALQAVSEPKPSRSSVRSSPTTNHPSPTSTPTSAKPR